MCVSQFVFLLLPGDSFKTLFLPICLFFSLLSTIKLSLLHKHARERASKHIHAHTRAHTLIFGFLLLLMFLFIVRFFFFFFKVERGCFVLFVFFLV